MGVDFVLRFAFKIVFFTFYLLLWQSLFFAFLTFLHMYVPTDNIYFQVFSYLGFIKAILLYIDLRIWIFTAHKAIDYWRS